MGLSRALAYVSKLTDKLSIGLSKWFFSESDASLGIVTVDRTDITCDQTDITCDQT